MLLLTTSLYNQAGPDYKEGIILQYGLNYPGYQHDPGLTIGGAYQFGKRRAYHIDVRGAIEHLLGGYSLVALSLATGLRYRQRLTLLAAYAGPSVVWREEDARRYSHGMGLYLQSNLFLFAPFLPEVGFGFITYANLNSVQSHYGVTLGVYMGNGK